MRERRSLVERSFGTIKAWMGHTHFLMKRLPNVKTEISLHILAYNMNDGAGNQAADRSDQSLRPPCTSPPLSSSSAMRFYTASTHCDRTAIDNAPR